MQLEKITLNSTFIHSLSKNIYIYIYIPLGKSIIDLFFVYIQTLRNEFIS